VNEEQAIALARQGDQRAFAWLIGRYGHMVHTTAYCILRHREEAEEVAQDSFVKAYQNLAGFGGESKFSTWLFSITYRTAISQLRKRRGPTSDLEDLAQGGPAAWDPSTSDASDRRLALERALAQLPPADAAIISFFYLEEMSVDEIVTITGSSASNVKVKLHRSRKKLFELLHHQLKDELWTLIPS
jgi:RNA polymerase sigma-70 factor (ECF subfamily)